MSIELYSLEVIVIGIADGPSAFKVWLRDELAGDLKDDLQWLREEDMESHIVLDLANLRNLETASYGLMLDLRELAKESGYRLFFCRPSPPLQWHLNGGRL